MSFKYEFNADEIADLDAARQVFNTFTGSKFTLQKYIDFTVQSAIDASNQSAIQAAKLMTGETSNQTKKTSVTGAYHVH